MEDKFSKYRRAQGTDRPVTWPGWAAAGVLLALVIAGWMHAIPVYFPSDAPSMSLGSSSGAPGAAPLAIWKRPGELAVVFFDIGQGDGAFIQTPRGKNILIDSGEGRTPDVRFIRPVDAANRVILPFLQQIGATHLDVVIATHPHSDHMGSMADLIGNRALTVGQLWISGFLHPTSSNKKLLETAKRRKIPVYAPDPNQLPTRLDIGSDVSAHILFVDPSADSPNNSSIVLKMIYGHVSFLFTGDAEERVEKSVSVRWGPELKAQILKVGHHGSKTSSLPIFLNQVKPEAAVISVGSYNTFGHPRPEVLQRLRDIGAKIYRTDEQGSIFVFSDGQTYRVEPSRL
ncbi:MBL fold metallo-hydrolase [bacterium]|nr:MBL fold metallo-hydrolase [bacterium]